MNGSAAVNATTAMEVTRHSMLYKGVNRTFVRASHGDQAEALLVVLHWLGSTGTAMLQTALALNLSTRVTYVAPDGLWLSWNGGECCGAAMEAGEDDVGFVSALIVALLAEDAAPSRVLLLGNSNGAYLASRVALSPRPWALERVVLVAGCTSDEAAFASARAPMAVLQVHSAQDAMVRFDGCCAEHPCCCSVRDSPRCVAIPALFSGWARLNGCQSGASSVERRGPYACSVAEGCGAAARTEMCVHPSASHSLWSHRDLPTLAVVRAFLDAAVSTPAPPLLPLPTLPPSPKSEGGSIVAAAVLLVACVLLSIALLRRAMRAGTVAAYAPLDTTTR